MKRKASEKARVGVLLFAGVLSMLVSVLAGIGIGFGAQEARAEGGAGSAEGSRADMVIEKVWVDEGHESSRPEEITFDIYYDGNAWNESWGTTGLAATVTLREDTYDITYTSAFEQNVAGGSGLENIGKWTCKTRIPRDMGGDRYRVVETSDLTSYTSEYSTSLPEPFTKGTPIITLTNTYVEPAIGYDIRKLWDDEGHEDARPDSITVHCLRGGTRSADSNLYFELYDSAEPWETKVLRKEDAEVSANGKSWAWSDAFADLPEFDEHGDRITWSFYEEEVPNYENTLSANRGTKDYVWGLKNTYKPVITSHYEIQKDWVDEGHEDERPDSITVRLFANGMEAESVSLTEDEEWHASVDVPMLDEQGEIISYQVVEDDSPKYLPTYSDLYTDDGKDAKAHNVTITNSYIGLYAVASNAIESLPVQKFWDDADDKDGIRPDHITVRLLANDEPVDSVRLDAASGWKHVFHDLMRTDEDGNEVSYSVDEEEVDGYVASISGDEDEGFTITNRHDPKVEQPTPRAPQTPVDPVKPDLPQLGGDARIAVATVLDAVAVVAIAVSKRTRV